MSGPRRAEPLRRVRCGLQAATTLGSGPPRGAFKVVRSDVNRAPAAVGAVLAVTIRAAAGGCCRWLPPRWKLSAAGAILHFIFGAKQT